MEPKQTNLSSIPLNSTKWWTSETTAVVTGANRGIGLEVATLLAESGLTVIVTARDATRGLNAVELIRNHGPRVHFSLLDVADPASIAAFVAWFKDRFGQLDILVNNAAISFNGIHENTVKHAEVVLKTNFYGPKLLMEALLPVFRCSTSKSRILNLSSRLGLINKVRNPKIRTILEDEENLTAERIQGVLNLFTEHVNNGRWESEGWPETWTEYAVSKLALNAYSRVLAKRLKDCNISVNCFCPGFTQTRMTGGNGSHSARAAASTAAALVLAPPELLQTGKFTVGHSLFLYSKI